MYDVGDTVCTLCASIKAAKYQIHDVEITSFIRFPGSNTIVFTSLVFNK